MKTFDVKEKSEQNTQRKIRPHLRKGQLNGIKKVGNAQKKKKAKIPYAVYDFVFKPKRREIQRVVR